MIDAYTIGVTLALEDGVSGGLVTLRRELALLDSAIARSAAGLDDLYQLGRQLGIASAAAAHTPLPPIPKPIPEDGRQERPTTDEPSAPSVVHSASPIPPPRPPVVAPLHRDAAIVPAPAPPPPTHAPQAATRARTPPPEISRPVLSSVASTIKLGGAPRTVSTSFRQIAPEASPAPRNPEVARPRSGKTPVGLNVGSESSSAANPTPGFPLGTSDEGTAAPGDRPVAPPTTKLHVAPASATYSAARQVQHPSDTSASAAPQVRQSHPTQEQEGKPYVSPPMAGVRAEPRDAAPPPEAAATPHLSGDIMLDGTRLGRWIGEMLTSAMNRPPTGLTGVDPRAIPPWPTTQGR